MAGAVITRVLPAAGAELRRWTALAGLCPDPLLRREALASISAKRFHCQGGAALALLAGEHWREAVKFIVALQTISDYLDNLSDRAGCEDRPALRRLHLAMVHCVDPPAGGTGRALPDYYSLFPARDDGGYLASLISTCASFVETRRLPASLRASGRALVSMYRNLQVLKHGPQDDRVERLRRWYRRSRPMLTRPAPDGRGDAVNPPRLDAGQTVYWPEFAAASGSTLAVFATYSRAAGGEAGAPVLQSCGGLLNGYFPWICGLHILLDYLIDREEDGRAGDLNLTRYYKDDLECERRLLLFAKQALAAAGRMEWPGFHQTIVAGLLAVYLSDPKVRAQGLDGLAQKLLDAGGREAWSLYTLCLGLRRSGLA